MYLWLKTANNTYLGKNLLETESLLEKFLKTNKIKNWVNKTLTLNFNRE